MNLVHLKVGLEILLKIQNVNKKESNMKLVKLKIGNRQRNIQKKEEYLKIKRALVIEII